MGGLTHTYISASGWFNTRTHSLPILLSALATSVEAPVSCGSLIRGTKRRYCVLRLVRRAFYVICAHNAIGRYMHEEHKKAGTNGRRQWLGETEPTGTCDIIRLPPATKYVSLHFSLLPHFKVVRSCKIWNSADKGGWAQFMWTCFQKSHFHWVGISPDQYNFWSIYFFKSKLR